MDKPKETEKRHLEFTFQLSVNMIFMNSLGNAILFLMSNQKAKRYIKRVLRVDIDNRVNTRNFYKKLKS